MISAGRETELFLETQCFHIPDFLKVILTQSAVVAFFLYQIYFAVRETVFELVF